MAKHGPPGLGPALAGLGSREITQLTIDHEGDYDRRTRNPSLTSNERKVSAATSMAAVGDGGGSGSGGGGAGVASERERWCRQNCCDLCQGNQQSTSLLPTVMDRCADDQDYLRENVSNASQAYKVP